MLMHIQRNILLVLVLFINISSWGQQAFWVDFTDKGDSVQSQLEHPEQFLSSDAVERRRSQAIAIDASDLPVNRDYLKELAYHTHNIVSTSKWLNAAVVQMTNIQKQKVQGLPFVKSVWPVRELKVIEEDNLNVDTGKRVGLQIQDSVYGMAYDQTHMIQIDELHRVGFTGKGVRIAVLDGGFREVNTLAIFDTLRSQGRILATYDFVRDRKDIYSRQVSSYHGTKVLSTMAGYLPGIYLGTAPDAQFLLAVTERPGSESRQEEYNWIEAVEWADSVGVDIIHSSLSYNTFDNPEEDYVWEELDGQHAVTTIAADKAASKGIIVTTGAGNEGNNPWRRITAPCDGDSVLCVGATDKEGNHAVFSSVGPSADGQIKPDVSAMGQGTAVAGPDSSILSGNGTSYSSPLIAGLAACLVQAHPGRPSMDIIQAIRLSGHIAYNPDSIYGYGIPQAVKADSLLRFAEDLSKVVIPSPASNPKPKAFQPQKASIDTLDFHEDTRSTFRIIANALTLKTLNNPIKEVKILTGRQQVFFPKDQVQTSPYRAVFNIEHLLPGKYVVHIETEGYVELIRFDR